MNAKSKIHKTSKAVSIALMIANILLVCVGIMLLIGIFTMLFSEENSKNHLLGAYVFWGGNGSILEVIPNKLLTALVFSLTQVLLMMAVLYNVYKIFKDISIEYSPFAKKHVLRMKHIGIIIIVMTVIGMPFNSPTELYTTEHINWHIEIGGILIGVIIYCFSLVFEYGCILQKESDETL